MGTLQNTEYNSVLRHPLAKDHIKKTLNKVGGGIIFNVFVCELSYNCSHR
jgi:hypothetical protein